MSTQKKWSHPCNTKANWEFKDQISKGKYNFVRKHHVIKHNALLRFRDYLVKNEKEYDSLKDKDKDWSTIKYGYFILLSNLEKTPAELLSHYFECVDIETYSKPVKSIWGYYRVQNGQRKWLEENSFTTLSTPLSYCSCKEINLTGISTSELSGKTQSLMCFRDNNGCVTVETPNKLTRDYYGLLGLSVPSQVKINEFKSEVFKLIRM